MITPQDFIGWVIQPIGWFAGAFAAHWFSSRHVRKGTRRQINTLARQAIKTIEPFFDPLKGLHFDDVKETWKRFSGRLTERETAAALNDKEYITLDIFIECFGKTIAFAQTHAERAAFDRGPRKLSAEEQDEERRYYAQCFRDPLPYLGAAIKLLGSPDTLLLFEQMAEKARTDEHNMSLATQRLLVTELSKQSAPPPEP
jgi:hypothetical protein